MFERKFERVEWAEELTDFKMPERGSAHSAGYDIFYYGATFTIYPGNTSDLIRLGIKVKVPDDEFLMIVPRSSTGMKKNLMIANTTGVIDSDYYGNETNDGEIGLILYNYGNSPQEIKSGDRLIQGIFVKYGTTDDDSMTKKRTGGIGSTGI